MSAGLDYYLGTDVVPEILEQAKLTAEGRENFEFFVVDGPTIPAAEESIDLVCGFSLITHLLDEEVFELFQDTARVLRKDGYGIFSFVDFSRHKGLFLAHARNYKERHDVLKFFEPETLQFFAEETGFDVVEVIPNHQVISRPENDDILLDGKPAPESIRFGHCLLVLKKR